MKKMFAAVAAAFSLLPLSARAVETDGLVRDPSRIIKQGATYWVYGTGVGTQQYSSTDRVHWVNRGPAIAQAPAWLAQAVPGNKNNVVWAPDVISKNGKFFLFYSYSAWGAPRSAIGVATNASLDPRGWVDQGLIVASTGAESEGFNAIDPGVFEDAEGNLWMVFGSYIRGIRMVKLDANTGLRSKTDTKIYEMATRPGVPGNVIEAPYVHRRDGYYYLFVNWDWCCRKAKSSYNIRVGRSKSVTGPYVDRDGKSLNEGGGTLLLNAIFDNESGRTIDDQVGPGHVGILEEGADNWLSTHYEWSRNTNATTMNVQRLAWDADGWPRAVLDEGPWKLVSNLPLHNLASIVAGAAKNGARLQTAPPQAAAPQTVAGASAAAESGQRWRLRHLGEGFYSILSSEGGLALGTVEDSDKPGAKVELSPWANRAGQKWFAQRNEDGTFTFLSSVSNKAQALDVSDCNPGDGVEISTWNSNGLDCQKWALRLK